MDARVRSSEGRFQSQTRIAHSNNRLKPSWNATGRCNLKRLWSRDIDRHRLAVAKVILVPSDNETVASASCREYVALPGVAPLMVVPAGLADGSLETPENGRANNATRSITGGPGHDVIVEPATRPGPESMNSTSVMGRSCPASLALLIFRITHSMTWRVPASCR
jgi:hypothetical protein